MFDRLAVPANLVQIVNITQKDGSPLAPENWRIRRIGIVTMCWIAGGFNCLTPFFKGMFVLKDGEFKFVDLYWEGNASTGRKLPVEVEPGVFDFETNTSIYRFRILLKDEELLIRKAIEIAIGLDGDNLHNDRISS